MPPEGAAAEAGRAYGVGCLSADAGDFPREALGMASERENGLRSETESLVDKLVDSARRRPPFEAFIHSETRE
jgi:hypothetical protein